MSDRARPSFQLRVASGFYRFRESLFLLPALLVAMGIGLAAAARAVDRAVGVRTEVPFTLHMSSNAAAWLLSTVAGATITTAGVVFSLTVVSLQLASSQFSPRVMRSFIRDRVSQVVIGMLVATFVYCVLTLPNVSGEATDPAPSVSLTVAVVLTIITVVVIMAHLDHLARRLQVGQVVRDIATEGERVVHDMVKSDARMRTATDDVPPAPVDTFQVLAAVDGWVAQIAVEHVFAAAPAESTVRLETRVGAYIHQGEVLMAVWPRPAQSTKVARRLAAAVVIGDTRTMQEDVDFALRQLVDIGLRALSAAINDPSTAIEVVLRIGSLLRRVLLMDPPGRTVAGPNGRTLIRRWDLDPDEYIAHGFDQLRHAAPPQPQVAAALLRVLRMLIAHVEAAGHPEHVPALRRQIRLLLEALDTAPGLHPDDLARLRSTAGNGTDPADHLRPQSLSNASLRDPGSDSARPTA